MTSSNVVVKRVDTAEVGARKTKLYKVITEDALELETFDKALADAAFSTRGQEVPAEYEKDEKWGNLKLLSIAGAKPKPRARAQAGTQAGSPAPAPKQDNERVARQWSYGRATELLRDSGKPYVFPLDDDTKKEITEVADWLLKQTKYPQIWGRVQ